MESDSDDESFVGARGRRNNNGGRAAAGGGSKRKRPLAPTERGGKAAGAAGSSRLRRTTAFMSVGQQATPVAVSEPLFTALQQVEPHGKCTWCLRKDGAGCLIVPVPVVPFHQSL